jgi:MFS family permease
MTLWIVLAAVLVTVAAAVRSTWSPCGLSMLATITPLSELGRGHRYRATAAWFVVGSVVGGVTLGSAAAALTVGVDSLHLTARERIVVAFAATALAVASDLDLGGFHLPVHHRQVNERWLDRFRPWVYGAGFGWQVGTGLATYIMTVAVYLTIVLSALTGMPWLALGVGAVFGLVRGLSVLLGRRITSPQTLSAFHRRFFMFGPRVRRLIVAVQLAATELFAWLLSPWLALVVGAAALGGAIVWAERRRSRRRTTARTATCHQSDRVTTSRGERFPDDGGNGVDGLDTVRLGRVPSVSTAMR